jgi:methylphosphotriester-DNA--protein-cysteine methyltransferase
MAAMNNTQTAELINGKNAALAGSQPGYSTDNHRWAAVVARDADADGRFYYSVATTGVYCRPSCAARLARRENVAFQLSTRLAPMPSAPVSGRASATGQTKTHALNAQPAIDPKR